MKKIISIVFFTTTMIVWSMPSCKKKSFTPSCSGGTPSYSGEVKALIQNNCVNCHSGYATHSGLSAHISHVRATIIDGSMPKNGSLTTDEKNKIICWIDAGAPNN